MAHSKQRDLEIVRNFVEVYCKNNHRDPSGGMCLECQDLIEYAEKRLEKCPMDPKPKCKDCPVHCYKPAYREKMREVMRFSGMHHVKRGRLDWAVKYFL